MLSQPLSLVRILELVNIQFDSFIENRKNGCLGFEIARSLAKHGCHVILACRDLTKGEAACSKIRKEQVGESFFSPTNINHNYVGKCTCQLSKVRFIFSTYCQTIY